MAEFFVLDQNYFRSEELKQLIAARPKARFVITDVALMEMCKGTAWRETMRRSLETLSEIPGRVFVTHPVGVAFQMECADFRSIEGRLVNKEFTRIVRTSMNDFKAGADSPNGLSLIAAHIEGVQFDLEKHELNHQQNQEKFLGRAELMKTVLGPMALKELRQTDLPDEVRLGAIRSMALECATVYLRKRGSSDNRIKAFLRTKPLLLRYFISCFWHNVEWARKGGLNSLPAKRITNDILDQDYVVIASFFGTLLTKDIPAEKAHSEMTQVLFM